LPRETQPNFQPSEWLEEIDNECDSSHCGVEGLPTCICYALIHYPTS